MIGNFRPGEKSRLELFRETLLNSIPNPGIFRESIREALNEMHFDLIAVDVSKSMNNSLSEKRVMAILQMIVNYSPNAKLTAIDISVRDSWEKAYENYSKLLAIDRNGNTDLPNCSFPLTIFAIQSWLQMEMDGVELCANAIFPALVIEIGSNNEIKRRRC